MNKDMNDIVESTMRKIGVVTEYTGKRSEMFQELWHQPVPLTEWEAAFQASLEGDESRKTFFLPRG